MARIGIDYTAAAQQSAGIGRYVRELVRALLELDRENEYRLFAACPRRVVAPAGRSARFVRLPFDDRWLVRTWHRARLPLPVELFTGRIDLFHSPDFTLPPTLPGTRTVLTVHDLSFVRDPDSAHEQLRAYLNTVVPLSVKRAGHIVADSEATRRDLEDLWQTPPEKVTVVYCGVDARFQPVADSAALAAVRAQYHLGEGRYLLAVGTLHPRKNYDSLIRAFAPLASRHADLTLVIAGGHGWRHEETLALPAGLGMADRVRFPGFVRDQDLPALYSGASLLAFPSLYEGFGLPILEAMACGTPVVASDRSSMPEVTGDAGLQVDATDTEAWTAAMDRLLVDSPLAQKLASRGQARAARFTWQAAATLLLGVYRQRLAAPSGKVRQRDSA